MFEHYHFTAPERFMQYVQVDTQSDPQSALFPSTEKQKNLSRMLLQQLLQIGISDAHTDPFGYVYATLPANTTKKVPVICYCSHVDTAPDCSGAGVKPLLHKNFTGNDIILPDDPSQVLRLSNQPNLHKHIGRDIITASGLTLLGADDKAGLAIIIDALQYLLSHPECKHGEIKILFTPDEEVGRGTAKLDMARLGAQFGYTLDGGEAGSLEDETFSANGATITVNGVIAHPGYAKNRMVNALKVASAIVDALPKDRLSPETTEGSQGFVHPVRMEGIADKATVEFIIRAFDDEGLKDNEALLKQTATAIIEKFPGATMQLAVQEQYRNMKRMLDQHPEVVAFAEVAIQRSGLAVNKQRIRGGTDGSRLSFMGLPCANLFTGMQAIHSRLEWIGVYDMQKAVETLVHLSMIWEEKS